MKKLYLLTAILGVALLAGCSNTKPVEQKVTTTIPQVKYTTQSNTTYYLPDNSSNTVWSPRLTGVDYMNALKSTALKNVNTKATKAIMTTTFDYTKKAKQNYKVNTYTITAGYKSCKVVDSIDWKDLPVTKTIDLTNLECHNIKGKVNLLPELKAGQRVNVFFAKIDGITKDTSIDIK